MSVLLRKNLFCIHILFKYFNKLFSVAVIIQLVGRITCLDSLRLLILFIFLVS